MRSAGSASLLNRRSATWTNRTRSPDGKWIAFHATDTDKPEIYVASFPEFTDKRQLSADGGRQPLWRNDGKELFYLDLDGRMMVVPVTTGPSFDAGTPTPLFATGIRPNDASQYAVASDGQRFLDPRA